MRKLGSTLVAAVVAACLAYVAGPAQSATTTDTYNDEGVSWGNHSGTITWNSNDNTAFTADMFLENDRSSGSIVGLFRVHFVHQATPSFLTKKCFNREPGGVTTVCPNMKFTPGKGAIESVTPMVCKYDDGAMHDCATRLSYTNPFR
jgi:hypothetical protein